MVQVKRTFAAGKMNKVVDERLLPPGEYIDAQNLRLGSTETSEVGSIELTRGNTQITTISYNNTALSNAARCIGAIDDPATETIYWFVHDPSFTGQGATSPLLTTILDLVLSYNANTGQISYHLVSVQEGASARSTLNFNERFLITGCNLVDDLLFWTDNRNPPRCINVRRGYAPPTISANVIVSSDNFSAEEIRVIVRPPNNSPTVSLSSGSDEFNFLEERFISFAYRYRYEDGEFSATSQFSDPAFIPKQFAFSPQSFLNEGMINSKNVATVTFNTGSSLVKGIELLWKDNDNGIIKVMERIKKEGLFADNIDISRQFNTSKILTVLPDSEILRLYDNVPRFAKAQTLMGNRLVYGNYVENYDLKNADTTDALPTNIDYNCTLLQTEIGEIDLDSAATRVSASYTIGTTPITNNNAALQLDFSSVSTSLVAGATLNIGIQIFGYVEQSQGGSLAVNPQPGFFNANPPFLLNVEWEYTLPTDFGGVADLAASANFLAALGTLGAQPMSDCESGNTFTDRFNSTVPLGFYTTLSPYNPAAPPFGDTMGLYKTDYGITVSGQGITPTVVGDIMTLQFPAIRYSQLPTDTTSTNIAWILAFSIGSNTGSTTDELRANFITPSAVPSLHSNRGYEVGIVYMDAFKRSTTAFTSLNNSVHVGCSYSDIQNRIQVTIPPSQVAPWWSQSYKFVIKPDKTTYESIFANLVFREPGSADAYILLDGENSRKVEEGTRLIVKSDMAGPINGCKYVTVLEKKAQEKGFIIVPFDPADPLGPSVQAPGGVYMKIKASGVDLNVPPDAITTTGWQSKTRSGSGFPVLKLGPAAFNAYDSASGTYLDPIPLPAGTRVRMRMKFERRGKWGGGGSGCERRTYDYEPDDFFVGDTYDNIIDWWNAENIGDIIEENTGDAFVGNDTQCDIENNYYTNPALTSAGEDDNALNGWGFECVNGWRWYMDDAGNNNIRLLVRGTEACGTRPKARSKVEGEIIIFRAVNLLIFETMPAQALPDVWYEGADNYGIGANGNHLSGTTSGDVNQDIATGVSAQVLLGNFNCYAFGNGCESYTIRDSVKGDSFSLGNRVTATASQDYGRAHRFADLTYSGVYNDFSNINKLNEFNLGLLNFKPLEDSFGPTQKLVGRKSDILVLQEDKISYVLSGKNLLSDSTGGGAVTATPTVLGTQIARLEEYGISRNPESYAEYGYDKYFTDAKRGAVIKLSGGSHTTEQLEVVSEYGMRSWFRDLFIQEPNDIKLGGYDPYMNEYVINSSDILLPSNIPCINCDATYTYQFNTTQINFCVDFGSDVGTVTFETVETIDVILIEYDGAFFSGAATNFVSFVKGSQSPNTAQVTLISAALLTVTFVAFCVVPIPLNIRRLVINSPQYALPSPQRVHDQIQYVEGSYVSPTFPDNSATPDELLSMPNSIVAPNGSFVASVCETEAGFQGQGPFPTDGSTLSIKSTQVLATDDFVFNSTYHRLGYYRITNVVGLGCNYGNIITVIANSTFPALNAPQSTVTAVTNSVTAAMPAPTGIVGTDELWLVYDYRVVKEIELCHMPSATEDPSLVEELCCDCACPVGQNTTYTLFTTATQFGSTSLITFSYMDINNVSQTIGLQPGKYYTVCVLGTASPPNPIVLIGYEFLVDISIDACNCNTTDVIIN
tara:strand:+ start:23626 stop:28575 length:4950 start_codon:yes stop_codon:yes gene_type:complete